jgi:hypothetical protein
MVDAIDDLLSLDPVAASTPPFLHARLADLGLHDPRITPSEGDYILG